MDILPPSWFRPSHKAHAELVEEFGFLRRYFFGSWGILQVLGDARVRGEIGAVVVTAVGSVGRGVRLVFLVLFWSRVVGS